MKDLFKIASIIIIMMITACGDGVEENVTSSDVTIKECTTESMCTSQEKARWLAVKNAQCRRLGGSYCR